MSRTALGMPVFELPSDLKDEFKVLPYGQHETIDGQVQFDFTPEDAQKVIEAFKSRGIELLNDWEHQSISHMPGFEMFKAPDGRAPAAGWNGNLEARADGLWATKVRWTSDAVAALKSGAYRYFSPVLFIRDGHAVGIQSIGLTNEPRLKNIPALAARSDLAEMLLSHERSSEMSATLLAALAGALALSASATDQDVLKAVNQLRDKATAGETAATQLTSFKTQAETASTKVTELETKLASLTADIGKKDGEITAFKSQIDAANKELADAVLAFAIETGRIAPAAKDAYKAQVDKDPAGMLKAFKATAAGSAVPIGRLNEQRKEGEDAGAQDAALPNDPLVACKGVEFNPDRKKIHDAAVAYQAKNKGVSYVDALTAVSRK